MKKFYKYNDAIQYAEIGWKPFFESLSEKHRFYLLSIKSSGRRLSNPIDKPVIKAIEKAMKKAPLNQKDIVLYRGGFFSDFCPDRPYLATSFFKSVAKSFSKSRGAHIYRIVVRKGAPILPICGMGVLGCQVEGEVIIETSRLRKKRLLRTFYYE